MAYQEPKLEVTKLESQFSERRLHDAQQAAYFYQSGKSSKTQTPSSKQGHRKLVKRATSKARDQLFHTQSKESAVNLSFKGPKIKAKPYGLTIEDLCDEPRFIQEPSTTTNQMA